MQQKLLRVEAEGLEGVDIKNFPVVDDFIVDLSWDGSEIRLGYRVPSLDISVSFPWWNHGLSEMRMWGSGDFPCGSLWNPFWDRDQGWNLLIWLAEDRVYIAEGEGEGESDIYRRWFAVSVELYRSEWKRAIEELSRKTPS